MPNPAVGLIAGGTMLASGILSSNAQKNAAKSAASAETEAARLQIESSDRRFAEIQELLSPFVSAGTGALGHQQALLGLSGTDAQKQALSALSESPQMQAMYQQGENAILQNASATGGLRGGNIQAALAQFRPQLLNSMIESQYQKLAGLSTMGQNAAAGVGTAGMQTTQATNQALGNIGSAQAGAALARGQANANLYALPGDLMGAYIGARGKF